MLKDGSPRRIGRKTGFTLIELLVVVAIIAILAAMLLPIFAKVRDSAKLAMCVSNLKQIAEAVIMYVDDYNGFYPIGPITDTNGDPINGCPWYEGQCIGGQAGAAGVHTSGPYSPPQYRPLYKYTRKSTKLFRCPSEKKQWCSDEEEEFKNDYPWHVFGSSYELNGAFAYPGHSLFYQLFGTGTEVGGSPVYGGPRNVSEVRNTKRMVMVAERQLHYYWGLDKNAPASVPSPVYTSSDGTLYPPLGHMNDKPWTPAAFCDGHVAYILITPGLYGKNWAIAQNDWYYDAARTQKIGTDGDPN